MKFKPKVMIRLNHSGTHFQLTLFCLSQGIRDQFYQIAHNPKHQSIFHSNFSSLLDTNHKSIGYEMRCENKKSTEWYIQLIEKFCLKHDIPLVKDFFQSSVEELD